jgi:beta-glucanase (GH16 family)
VIKRGISGLAGQAHPLARPNLAYATALGSIIRSLEENDHTDRIAQKRSRNKARRAQRVTTVRSIPQQLLSGKTWPVAALIVSATLAVCVLVAGLSNRYTFDDEFNGPAGAPPDPTKWSYDIEDGGWGNNELQSYTDTRQNSFLDGEGHLVIRATRTVDRNSRGRPAGMRYNSARLTTVHHFSQKQGHWEARIQINSKRGLWPAWWLLGQNYPVVGWPQCGEVDIVEDYGFSRVESSIHAPKRPSGYTTSSAAVGISEGFHVYRLDWTAENFTFLVDGVKYTTLPSATSGFTFRQPMFMVLNLAIGGRVGNPPPDTLFPIDLIVDYVRVWQ